MLLPPCISLLPNAKEEFAVTTSGETTEREKLGLKTETDPAFFIRNETIDSSPVVKWLEIVDTEIDEFSDELAWLET